MASLRIFICLIVISQIVCRNGFEARRLTLQENLQLDGELNVLNKQPIKTFHIENGDIYDCIDIYKQPTLDHPLLRNHKIQMKPTFFRQGLSNITSFQFESSLVTLRGVNCPQGTVPIRRTRKEDLIRAKSFIKPYATNLYRPTNIIQGQHIAIITPNNDQNLTYYGANAYINVYNVEVKAGQRSSAQMWIENGRDEQQDSLQAGWIIDNEINNDTHTRFFGYWAAENGKNGCHNTLCQGFVQVDSKYTLGMEINRLSTYGKIDQVYIMVNIFQDQGTGNWFLTFNNTHVGYWPKSIVPNLATGASLVAWGGETIALPNGDSPPMGNGHFPNLDFIEPEGCFIGGLHMFDASNTIIYPDQKNMKGYVDNNKCYDVKYYGVFNKFLEQVLKFGGPGGQCDGV